MCKENAHAGQGNKRNQKIEHRTLLKRGTLNTHKSVTAFCFRIVSSLQKMASLEPDGDLQAVCSASVTVATHLSAACSGCSATQPNNHNRQRQAHDQGAQKRKRDINEQIAIGPHAMDRHNATPTSPRKLSLAALG